MAFTHTIYLIDGGILISLMFYKIVYQAASYDPAFLKSSSLFMLLLLPYTLFLPSLFCCPIGAFILVQTADDYLSAGINYVWLQPSFPVPRLLFEQGLQPRWFAGVPTAHMRLALPGSFASSLPPHL